MRREGGREETEGEGEGKEGGGEGRCGRKGRENEAHF